MIVHKIENEVKQVKKITTNSIKHENMNNTYTRKNIREKNNDKKLRKVIKKNRKQRKDTKRTEKKKEKKRNNLKKN